ncbi:MAG: oxygenase MpaB family protein [Acidimicrobiales bacterium]|nr:oxygenase MpaB family protein [Acidimicrobiales bacterium]
MTDRFPKGSVVRRVNLEPAIMFGAGRALLLQLAHEAVAQGVEEHSDFKGNPFKRLLGTLEAMYAVVYGSEELARGVGRRIQWIHTFVVGPTYSANDPANLMWVHATLADTALRCYTELVGPLSPADAETYYQEMTRVAEVFGVPRDQQPATLAEFEAYVDEQIAAMDVTAVGRDLASFILDPKLPFGLHLPLRPLLAAQRMLTLGALPAPIRSQLGAAWDARAQRRYDRARRLVRTAFRVTPRALRVTGPRLQGVFLLWLAERHVRQFDERQAARAAQAAA